MFPIGGEIFFFRWLLTKGVCAGQRHFLFYSISTLGSYGPAILDAFANLVLSLQLVLGNKDRGTALSLVLLLDFFFDVPWVIFSESGAPIGWHRLNSRSTPLL